MTTFINQLHLTPAERELCVTTMQLDPAWAGAREADSWRRSLMDGRETSCPDGTRHDLEFLSEASNGYYSRCRRCGHHSDVPF